MSRPPYCGATGDPQEGKPALKDCRRLRSAGSAGRAGEPAAEQDRRRLGSERLRMFANGPPRRSRSRGRAEPSGRVGHRRPPGGRADGTRRGRVRFADRSDCADPAQCVQVTSAPSTARRRRRRDPPPPRACHASPRRARAAGVPGGRAAAAERRRPGHPGRVPGHEPASTRATSASATASAAPSAASARSAPRSRSPTRCPGSTRSGSARGVYELEVPTLNEDADGPATSTSTTR